MTEQDFNPVESGQAIARLLEDRHIQQIFEERTRLYFESWQAASTLAAREEIWAQAKALTDLIATFQAVVDAGVIATHNATASVKAKTGI